MGRGGTRTLSTDSAYDLKTSSKSGSVLLEKTLSLMPNQMENSVVEGSHCAFTL